MSSQRKLIRTACAQWLKSRSTIVPAANIFASRSRPLIAGHELPALCVYGVRETVTLFQESPRQYKRELELRIEVIAQGEDADDQLDDIGYEVEQIIGRSNRLTYAKEQVVSDILLSGDQIEFRPEGEQVVGSLIKTYTATYYSYEPDEYDEEPVDDLNTVGTEYNLSNEQAAPERASDLVEFDND